MSTRIWEWVRPRVHLLLPLAVYLVLVLFGITTSSIGVSTLREDPAHPTGHQLLNASAVRSDEYNTESPLWLGQMAIGPGESVNPLSVSPDFFAQIPDGPVSAVVFFDGSMLYLGPWLPDAMLFAAKWWLPTLMLGLGVPVWFKRVTGSMRWGYLCAILIFFSPATAWWSMRPINTLGFVFAGCALGMWAIDEYGKGKRLLGVLGLVAAGILLARFPSYYQPLAIIVGFPPVLATVAHLLFRDGIWRRKVLSVVALGVSGAVWTGAVLLESMQALQAGLHTGYPGGRSSTGEAVSLGQVFGATNLAFLHWTDTGPTTNTSEIATSFTVLFVVLAILVWAARWRGTRAAQVAFWATLVPGLFWLSWCTIAWGQLGYTLPLANRVPPMRAANGVGFIAVIAFCMFMAQWRRPARPLVAIIASGAAGLVSAYAGLILQSTGLLDIAKWQIGVAAVVTSGLLALLILRPDKNYPMVLTTIVTALSVALANPILFGLADLRDSDSAKKMLAAGAASRKDGTLWASDSVDVDSLLLATGTPALSTRQQIGPDDAQWRRLDPTAASKAAWNRGGTYIRFAWTESATLTITNPTLDVVVITGSPCVVHEDFPELRYIISDAPLKDSCLTRTDQLTWSGIDYIVYRTS